MTKEPIVINKNTKLGNIKENSANGYITSSWKAAFLALLIATNLAGASGRTISEVLVTLATEFDLTLTVNAVVINSTF